MSDYPKSDYEFLIKNLPSLSSSEFEITSPRDPNYNCVAHAIGVKHEWWEPDQWNIYHWPIAAPLTFTVDAYIAALKTEGFTLCDDGSVEDGYEKVALFAKSDVEPTHVARQLKDGYWTSKLGREHDIKHYRLEDLCGDDYGSVVKFLKRPTPIF
jgi:hypothetical protein